MKTKKIKITGNNEKRKNRCQYSKEGLKTFGKQRRGYVVGKTKYGSGWIVIWDNKKSRNAFSKDFIDINPSKIREKIKVVKKKWNLK